MRILGTHTSLSHLNIETSPSPSLQTQGGRALGRHRPLSCETTGFPTPTTSRSHPHPRPKRGTGSQHLGAFDAPLSKVVNSLSCSIASPLSPLLSPSSPCIDCCRDLDTGQHLHLDNSSAVRVSSGEPTHCHDAQRLGHGRHLDSRRQQKWLTAPFGSRVTITIRITDEFSGDLEHSTSSSMDNPSSAKLTKHCTTNERYDKHIARSKGDNRICVSNKGRGEGSQLSVGRRGLNLQSLGSGAYAHTYSIPFRRLVHMHSDILVYRLCFPPFFAQLLMHECHCPP